ncbi:MAG: hypothetical protein OXU92_04740 [Deltaproteobacteria bacterium]|nr:hypothetical protein [Deltaproteobacteria bacterium]
MLRAALAVFCVSLACAGAAAQTAVSVRAESAAVSEGQSGAFVFALSASSTGTTLAFYRIAASSTASAEDFGGRLADVGVVEFQAGVSSVRIAFDALNDGVVDDGEVLVVELVGVPGGAALGMPATAQVTLNDHARSVTITGPARITEGATARYALGLAGWTAPAGGLELRYRIVGTGSRRTAAGDFAHPLSGSVHIAAGGAAGSIRVVAATDDLAEGIERFVVEIVEARVAGVAPPEEVATGQRFATEIADLFELSLSGPAAPVAEGETARFAIRIAGGALTQRLFLSFRTSLPPGEGDLSRPPGTARGGRELAELPAGQREVLLDYSVLDEGEVEDEERFVVELLSFAGAPQLPGALRLGTVRAEAVIPANGGVLALLSGRTPGEVAEESGARIVFSVQLRGEALMGGVSLHFRTRGNATAGTDYEVLSEGGASFDVAMERGTLVLAAGVRAGEIAVRVLDDGDFEEREIISLELTSADAALPGETVAVDDRRLRAAILPSDTIYAAIRARHAEIDEGDMAVFNITLSRAVHTSALRVDYTVSGSATAGADYTGPPGTVQIATGENNFVLRVATADDAAAEAAETLIVTLSALSGGGIAGPLSVSSEPAQVTLRASDQVWAVTRAVAAEVSETGSSGVASDAAFDVCLEGGMPGTGEMLRVRFRLSGSAALRRSGSADPYDYEAGGGAALDTDGSFLTQAFSALGCQRISHTVNDDALNEGGETIVLTLVEITGAASLPLAVSSTAAQVTIAASDETQVSVASLDSAPLAEGAAARFGISYRGGVPTALVMLNYAIGGDVESSEYTDSNSGAITFAADAAASARRIEIATVDDSAAEPPETLTLTLSSVSGGGGGGLTIETASASAVIAPNDGALHAAPRALHPRVVEGYAPDLTNEAQFRICLSGAALETGRDASVRFRLSGSAQNGDDNPGSRDYAPQPAAGVTRDADTGEYIHSFSDKPDPGEACGPTLAYSIRSDRLNEGEETIVLTLTQLTGGNADSTLSYDSTPVQVIIVADGAIPVSLTGPAAAVAEGGTAVWTVAVEGTERPSVDIGLPWTLSGVAASDVSTPLLGVRSITPADVAASRRSDNPVPITIAVGIVADGLTEDAETLWLTLDNSPERGPSGAVGGIAFRLRRASVRIPANDGVRAVPSAATAEAPEGGVARFAVRLIGEVHSSNLLLNFALSGDATEGSDYSLPPQSWQQVIAPGVRSSTIEISITDDAEMEGAESLIMRLTQLAGLAADGPFSVDATPAEVTILGSDGIYASLRALQSEVTEPGDSPPAGGVPAAAVFAFCLSGDEPAAPVTVSFDGNPGAAQLWNPAFPAFADYRKRGGTGSFIELSETGCTSVTFDVLEDVRSEPAEDIRLRITGIRGPGAGAPLSFSTDTAASTIRASDAVELALRGPAMQVQEGADAVFEIVVSGGIPTADIVVPLRLSGVAAADLSAASLLASRSITPVQAVAARRSISPEPITIAIGIADDALLESAETLLVALDDRTDRRPSGGGGGGVLIAPGEGQAQAVIAGSDGIRAEVTAAQTQVAEGGEAVFRIALAGEAHTAALFVDYRVGGTARAGVDHTGLAMGTLRIPVAETGGELRFSITDDSRTESGETIVVTLSALRGGGLAGGALSVSSAAARTTISGSDGLIASVLVARNEVVESDEASFNEFSSVVFRICIEGEAPGGAVQVQYSVGGTAQPLRTGSSLDPTQPRPPGSGLPFADYYLLSGGENGIVTLPGLGCSGEIEFGIYGDSLNEGAERIGFELNGISGGNCAMGGCRVSLEGVLVSIRASDPISASVSGPATAQNEGSNAVFRVTLSGGTPTANVVIPYRIGGAGIDSGDYTDAGNGSLAITPAQAAAAAVTPLGITIAINDDTVIEPQETLRLSLETPSSAGSVSVSPPAVSVAIADSDSASAVLSGGVTVPENGRAVAAFTLSLLNGAAQRSTDVPVRILYTLSGTAQQGADYTLSAGAGLSLTQAAQMGGDALPAIVMEAGSSGGELRIEPVNDGNNEPDETVTLQLGRVLDGMGVDFARITVGAAAAATISDDDEITLTLSGGDGMVNEGGSAVFRVALSGGVHSAELVVPFSIGATADDTDTDAQAADYLADSSPLRIAQGTNSAEIRVRIVPDGVMEPAESFALSLGAPSGGGGGSLRRMGSPRTATIAASMDTDRSVSLSGPALVSEGASARYTVSISGDPPTADVEVSWKVTSSGANSAVEADFSGGALPIGGPLIFTPANYATAQNFEVAALRDTLLEGPQSFTITLSVMTTSADVTSGHGVSLHAAIADANTARVRLARSDADGFGEAGADGSAARSAVFTASVSGAQLTAAAQLDFSVSGCGGGADCTFSQASPLVIAQGSSSASITVTAVDDALNEAAESIRVSLSAARSAGRMELDSVSAAASLADDDAMLVTIANASLDADTETSGVQVNEGGAAVFRVTLSGAASGSAATVMVPYTVSGSVTAQDYRDTTASRSSSTAGGGTLLIPAATTSGDITLEIVRDVLAESAETLQVTLGAALSTGAGGGAISLGTGQSAAISIPQNASTERSFSVTAEHASRSEGQTAVFNIALAGSAPMGAAATVEWALSGVSDGDYSAPSAARGTLRFTSTGSQQVRVEIREDGLNEAAETLKLTLSNAAGGGVGGASIGRAEATTTIAASDPITYAIGADYSVNEGDSGSTEVSFTVSLSGASASAGGPLSVPFVLLAGSTAEESVDYTLSASPLLIRGAMAELRIFVLGDALFEADETVILELGTASTGPGGGALMAGRRRATLTIINDDAAPIRRRSALILAIARADDDGFAEGGAGGAGTARFRVSLSGGAPQQPVSALFSVDGDRIDAGDYEIATPPVSGAVSRITITPPATSAEIVIRALDDSLNEGAETLRVTLSTPVGGGGQAIVLGTAEASATLAASDGASLRLTRDTTQNLDEGEVAGVWVEMDFVSAGDVSVEWQAAVVAQTNTEDSGPRARNGPAAPEFRAENGGLRADGLGVSGVLQIPAGARRAVFHIIPARDQREEDAEVIRVVLGAVNVGQGGGAMAVGGAMELRVNANTAGEPGSGENERRARRVTTALAALDRGAAGLANGAIRARMALHHTPLNTTPPWLRIAGHAWRAEPPGASAESGESGESGAFAESGARAFAAPRLGLALYGAAGRGGGGVNFVNLRAPGAVGAAGAAGDSGASVLAARAGPFRGLGAGLAGDANFGRRSAGPGRAGWLRGSGLEFGSAERSDSQSGVGAFRVWASGDLAESRFDAGSGGMAWEAQSSAAHIGVETQLLGGALLAGAALGAADGSLDFTERASGAELRGTAESLLLSLHPYLGWQLSPGFHAWFTLGYGRGDFRISERRPAAAAVQARSNSILWTTAGGVSGKMRLRQRFDLALSLETMQTRSRSDAARFADGALLPAVSAGATRISGEVELALNFAPGGISLRPFASLRTRRDSGDGSATQSAAGAIPGGTRTATDGGGGLALDWPSQGLAMDLRGMTQLLEGGVGHGNERSFSLSASWDPGVLRRGLRLAVESGHEPGLMGEVAYGISLRPAFAPVGVLLTPYSRMAFGAAQRRWSAGLRLRPNGSARGARWERAEALHFGIEGGVLRRPGAPEERELRLRADLRF